MILQEKADPRFPLGIYFHFPFCATHCDFCAFYQKPPRRGDIETFLSGMECELNLVPFSRKVDTVFWGGGTPGLLPAGDLERMGGFLLDKMPRGPLEWTVEMAPSTVKADKVSALRNLGVNRISLGVESFSSSCLKLLGRRHAPAQVYRAVDLIRSGGVENLNLDLMFSIPGQMLKDWERDLREAIRLSPEHISTYCLTFEEETVLFRKLKEEKLSRKSEKEEKAFYEATWTLLAEAGYRQYEISNFAKPGFQCRHNANTWRMFDWLGYGPSASSQFENRRFTNIPSLQGWIEGLRRGVPNRIDVVPLNPELLASDCLIFGLRMNEGVSLPELRIRFPETPFHFLRNFWKMLETGGFLETDGGETLRLTPKGRLVADGISAELIAEAEAFGESRKPRR